MHLSYQVILIVLVTVQFTVSEEGVSPILKKRVCESKPEYGLCGGHRRLWYYETSRDTCRQFTYSNCGGNRNRFYNKESCMEYCGRAKPTKKRPVIL